MPVHAHDDDKVSIMLSGSVRETSGRGERLARAGSIVVKPAGFIHEDRMGKDGLTVLSMRVHSNESLLVESWQRLVDDYRWIRLNPSVKLMISLWKDGIEDASSTVEELVHCMASTIDTTRCPLWFSKVESILADQLVDPPSLMELARQISVHPVTLSKAFAATGTSKAAVVHRLRMQIALHRLASTIPLNYLAADLGYSDASHFSRTFRRWFGVSPETYRREFCHID